MAEHPFISICIPAFKHAEYLKRLLDSIALQSFRDFDVVITDDSPDTQVQTLALAYEKVFPLKYFRNPQPAGTPGNWNMAIRKATGQWIKLMHDDDWFSDKESLQLFADTIENHPGYGFLFSAYQNVVLKTGKTRPVFAGSWRISRMVSNPATLFSRNIIGPPSVTIHRADLGIVYDEQLRWVVDIDFYIRCLKITRPYYLPKLLVKVGIGDQQVTMDCFRQRPIEIPENFYLLQKVGEGSLKNIMVYDAWWRLMRNLEIRSVGDIRRDSAYSGEVSRVIASMIHWQAGIPKRLLRAGPVSKCLMFFHFILNYRKIPN